MFCLSHRYFKILYGSFYKGIYVNFLLNNYIQIKYDRTAVTITA